MRLMLDDPLRFVLLDDDANFLKTISLQLKYQGHSAETFAAGPALLRHLEQEFADIVILDVHMPGMDGVAVLQAIRGLPQGRDLAVFMLTADSSRETVQKVMVHGISGYLLKPLDFRRFLQILKEMNPALQQRREMYFLRWLMDSLEDPDLPESQKRVLVAQAQKSALYRKLVDDPTSLPADFRKKIAMVMSQLDRDLDQTLLEHIDPKDDDQAMESLKLIDEIAGGRPLSGKLNVLLASGNEKLASKAAKILGKTSRDAGKIRQILMHTDPRLVANLIEALWDSDTPLAMEIFQAYCQAESPRVRANSLVGLYRRGKAPAALAGLREMLESPDSGMIQSALWVCGYLGTTEIREVLVAMTFHPDRDIRGRARNTLERILERPFCTDAVAH